jgi:4-hydroxysphinganine ceramide fatty acyl 2-hydroxylase
MESVVAFVLGMITWSLTEYSLHRWLFHAENYWLPDNYIIIAFHFLLNGNHHAFPQDPKRLTFPLIPAYFILYINGALPLSYVVPE